MITYTRAARWLSGGRDGICLPPLGIFLVPDLRGHDRAAKHELHHWHQYRTLGFWRFYWRYLTGFLRFGYHDHPMEVEARAAEHDGRSVAEIMEALQ